MDSALAKVALIRRSKLEVMVDILKVIAEEREIRRTRIMYRANLAWKVLREALDFLEKNRILESRATPSGVFVSLTAEGYKVLQRYTEIESVFVPIAPAMMPPIRQSMSF